MPDAMQLEYAARERRWHRKRTVIFIGLLITIASVSIASQPLTHRASLLYWQHTCFNFAKPPQTPILSPDPSRAGNPDYFIRFDGSRYAIYPLCWQQFKSKLSPGTRYTSLSPEETVFLHEMTSPSGKRRLVHVWLADDNGLTFPNGLMSDIVIPATLFNDASVVTSPFPVFGSGSGSYYRIHACFGQLDPADPSHLTIQTSERGTIDGWLNDNETLVFKRR